MGFNPSVEMEGLTAGVTKLISCLNSGEGPDHVRYMYQSFGYGLVILSGNDIYDTVVCRAISLRSLLSSMSSSPK